MKRRTILEGASAALLLPNMQACSWLLPKPNPRCLFGSHSPINSGLLIDTHAHFFNGTDLQVAAFIKQVAGRELIDWVWLREAAGDLLQLIAWNAPSAKAELRLISQAKECSPNTYEQLLRVNRDKKFVLAKEEFLAAVEKQSLKEGGLSSFANVVKFHSESLPKTYDELYSIPESTFTAHNKSGDHYEKVIAVFRFVVEMFQYRYVSANNYLNTYNTGIRKIDLVVAHLVDYDWFIARGRSTQSSIPQQVKLMGEIAKVSNGIVNYFAPYCPLRHVAWNAGKKAKNFDPLVNVKNAVEEHGALGVKLYPPMGFSLWENKKLQELNENLWLGRKFLPEICKTTDFGKKLDDCLALLYEYCQENNVPIMAHTAISNLSDDHFKVVFNSNSLTKLVTIDYPRLKISFGHFGGFGWSQDKTKSENSQQESPTIWRELLLVMQAASNKNLYVDTGFFSSALEDEAGFKQSLHDLLAANPALADTMLYGTDWKMLVTEESSKQYLKVFERILNQPEIKMLISGSQKKNILGLNAADYLGLHYGENNNYARAKRFYGESELPHWFFKV